MSVPTVLHRVALGLCVLSATGCVRVLDEETSTSGRKIRDCEVPVPPGVVALGAPVSLEYEDGSLFVFGLVELEGGGLAQNAAAFVSDAADLCANGPELQTTSGGALSSLLTKTPSEIERDATRTDGRQLWLMPTGGFVHDARGYLFYEHLEGTSLLESTSLGTGLCTVEPGTTTCTRVEALGGTVLFSPEEPFDQGGIVIEDHALVFGCRVVADFTRLCTVSGAPLDALEDPDAYARWNTEDGWVDDPRAASVLSSAFGTLTVSEYLGAYLATSLDPFDGVFYVQRMASATEPFGRRMVAFEIAANEAAFPTGGHEHVSLRDHPREITVTYGVTRDGVQRLHLATFRFHSSEFGEPSQPQPEGDGA